MLPIEPNGLSHPSPDFRTQGQNNEKDLFHILPQLQVKRADFLTVMLTGILPQRRTFPVALPLENEVQEPQGPRDDDVTKSESSSEASQKSTERSQDGAPDTLMAEDDPRGLQEHASAADADPDLEDGTRTLVLFSPGDTRKSPSTGRQPALMEVDLGTLPAANRDNKPIVVEGSQPDPLEQHAGLSFSLQSDLKSSTPIAPASPPFTKVERTFVHIAETSHFNVMSSSCQNIKECSDRGKLSAITQEVSQHREACNVSNTKREVESQNPFGELQIKSVTDGTPENGVICPKVDDHRLAYVKSLEHVSETTSPILEHKTPSVNSNGPLSINGVAESNTKILTSALRLRIKSRIPVLLSEEDTGSERSASLSARAQVQKRARQLDLARLVVQKQQGRWIRLASGTSSSLSSGDGKASETLSTTGSEEDTHASDESLARRSSYLKANDEASRDQAQREWRSRIPRPVTPIKRPSGWLVATVPSPFTLPGTGIPRAASTLSNVLQVPQTGLSTLQGQSKSLHTGSFSSCPRSNPVHTQPCGSPRMPLRCAFGTRRSLSTSHCRTDSPSPQRSHTTRHALSIHPTTAPLIQARTKATTTIIQRANSHDPTKQASSTMPARVRAKSMGPTKAKPSTRDKMDATR